MEDSLEPLAKFLISINENLPRSVWLRVFDNPASDEPDSVVVPDVREASNEAEAFELQHQNSDMGNNLRKTLLHDIVDTRSHVKLTLVESDLS